MRLFNCERALDLNFRFFSLIRVSFSDLYASISSSSIFFVWLGFIIPTLTRNFPGISAAFFNSSGKLSLASFP